MHLASVALVIGAAVPALGQPVAGCYEVPLLAWPLTTAPMPPAEHLPTMLRLDTVAFVVRLIDGDRPRNDTLRDGTLGARAWHRVSNRPLEWQWRVFDGRIRIGPFLVYTGYVFNVQPDGEDLVGTATRFTDHAPTDDPPMQRLPVRLRRFPCPVE